MNIVSPHAHFMFRRLIVEVKKAQDIHFVPAVEIYLTHLLVQHIRDTDIGLFRIAEQMQIEREIQGTQSQRVFFITNAEACLLIVGFFPQICTKRGVSTTYYEYWGRQMYARAAQLELLPEETPVLDLEGNFKRMARTLRGIRGYRDRVPGLPSVRS